MGEERREEGTNLWNLILSTVWWIDLRLWDRCRCLLLLLRFGGIPRRRGIGGGIFGGLGCLGGLVVGVSMLDVGILGIIGGSKLSNIVDDDDDGRLTE